MLHRSALRSVPALLVVLLTMASADGAPLLFGTQGYGGTASTLVELNPATGAVIRTIGPVGYRVNGLTFDVATGQLYGSTSYSDPTHNGLILIDMNTGAGTPIGADGWGTGARQAITNITTNSSGQMFGWTEAGDSLVSIDKATGTPIYVFPYYIGTGEHTLSFDTNDNLYLIMFGDTYQVDPGTGAVTWISNYGTDPLHHGDFDPVTNLFYGLTWTYDPPRSLYSGDVINGGPMVFVGEVGNLHTLTFAGDYVPSPIPEPSTFLALGTALSALYLFRRRRE